MVRFRLHFCGASLILIRFMASANSNFQSVSHHRWLAGYSFLTFAATLVLLYAGGFTTTIGAGMVFPDWPLSNGSLNPPGWTTDQAMLAEHGHRLMGATVGLLCIGLVFFVYRVPTLGWVRLASWLALGLVIFQGMLGGLRVLLVSLDLAKVHGVVAQVFLCLLASIAIGTSAWWKRIELPQARELQQCWKGHRHVGLILCLLIMAQLVVGAVMRHRGAGLAIPYFPHSSPDGGFLPVAWNWATQLHMAHRVVAIVIYILLLSWLMKLFRQSGIPAAVARLGWAALFLVHVQILLGAMVIWSTRQPVETTLHVLNGAIFLSVCWAMTFVFWKPQLESGAAAVSSPALSAQMGETSSQPLPAK